MQTFTVTLPAKAIERLNILVARTNLANSTAYDLEQWLNITAREMAIAEDLHMAVSAFQRQDQNDQQLRVNEHATRVRDDLLTTLDS